MIDQTISHYKIIEKIGSGGMGVVYKAEDTKLKRTVALKFLPPALSMDDDAKTRFIHEARAASALDHPNICTIHEIGETEDGQSYIAMACYDGHSLHDIITPQGDAGATVPVALSIDQIISITIQIAKGLSRAHDKGIVHRDIKPANIMITEQDEVKILDFGLAKLTGHTQLTKTGSTVGTIAYMSPEQSRGEVVDHRTDIWSLGVVMYEMLTGKLPFGGDYEQAMIYSILNEEPEVITNLNENVSGELQNIVLKSLAKDPENRYLSIDELLSDLKKSGTEGDISFDESLPKLILRMWRKKLVRRLSAAVSVLVTVTVFLFLFWPKIVQPTPIAVISFENQTGDESNNRLSRIIPNLLITNLQQSGNFKVITWERLHDLKKRLGKENVEFINSELGFELCRLEGVPNIVIGSIAKIGDIFATDLKILDVETKEILQSAQARGEGNNSIFAQIDALTREIVTGLGGLSEEKFSSETKSIMDVTTTSLEAYNYFLRGREDFEKGHDADARKFLKKAIDIDSTFAVAYLYLGITYDALQDPRASKAIFEKAKKYSENAMEKDRLLIDTYYARYIENDMDKHLNILNELVDKYPQEKRAQMHLALHSRSDKKIEIYNNILDYDPYYGPAMKGLAYTYARRGNLKKADEYLKNYASVLPGDADPFNAMANIYYNVGRLDEAIVKYKEALAVKPNFGSNKRIAYIYSIQENYSEVMKLINQHVALAPSTGLKATGLQWKGFYNLWLGRYDSSLSNFDQSIQLSGTIKDLGGIGSANLFKAWLYYDIGEYNTAKKHFDFCTDTWISLHPDWEPNNRAYNNFFSGLVDLKEGRIDSAQARLDEMKSFIADITLFKNLEVYRYQILQSELLLAKDSIDKAISEYKKVSDIETPGDIGALLLMHNLTPGDILARAYIQKGDLYKAITEYEQMITFDPDKPNRRLVRPRYHYRLAKLYQEKDQKDKAINQYQRFLDIWKYADKDQPDLIDARKRLADLVKGK